MPSVSTINGNKDTPELSAGQRVITSMLDKYKIETVRENESNYEKAGITTIYNEQANQSTDTPNIKSSIINWIIMNEYNP